MPEILTISPATLGIALRTARAQAGLSLGELARRTGFSKALLSRIERDRCRYLLQADLHTSNNGE